MNPVLDIIGSALRRRGVTFIGGRAEHPIAARRVRILLTSSCSARPWRSSSAHWCFFLSILILIIIIIICDSLTVRAWS